jgi:CheY-like chemotaxis protein
LKQEKVIMVLDPSLTTRKILEVILQREGLRVISFADPVRALQYLLQHPPDLLFLSIDLPRLDGYTVLKYLKSRNIFQHVIVITLLDQRDGVLVHLKARLAGAKQTVTKPLVRQSIVALVFEQLYHGAETHVRWQR